jgi:hypothetical protein
MTWGLLNGTLLVGLFGAAVPVVIHLLNRRRDPVVDWGAMQFLDLGHRAQRKLRITELLLMLARMGLLAIVALALARPYCVGSGAKVVGALSTAAPARDVVIVVDVSASMNRRLGAVDGEDRPPTPRSLTVDAARQFVAELQPGDSVALLLAGDRVRAVVDPPSFDHAKVDAALLALASRPERAQSSDLPAALAEAFRVLERTQNPAREVLVFTDGQRFAWRPGEPTRWALVRELHRRVPVAPRVWAMPLGTGVPSEVPNGSVGTLKVSRALVTPGAPLIVSTDIKNAGPGSLTRSADLLINGRPVPGSTQVVGPIPPGGRIPLAFRTTLPNPGSHLVTVKLTGQDDALADDDEASVAVTAAAALPVLLVDGEPGREPLSGETDFLRAALAPIDDDTPQIKATVTTLDQFKPTSLEGQSVLMLANVARLNSDQAAAISRFVEAGGGMLLAPGDRTDAAYFSSLACIPAALGERIGDFSARKPVAHPAPATFTGPVLSPFAQGNTPALGEADLFAYNKLVPLTGAFVSARLDTGEPWAVQSSQGKGRVLVLAGPLDGEGGTLPANPDFVPLVHEWAFHLADGSEPRAVKPGEPLLFDLVPAPAPNVAKLPLSTPGGTEARAVVTRASGLARARFDDTAEAGVYRLSLPEPAGGYAYATVEADSRESDLEALAPAEAAKLAEGWPFSIEPDTTRLAAKMIGTGQAARRELWRSLILAALGGLCIEIYLTRRLVRGQGFSRP